MLQEPVSVRLTSDSVHHDLHRGHSISKIFGTAWSATRPRIANALDFMRIHLLQEMNSCGNYDSLLFPYCFSVINTKSDMIIVLQIISNVKYKYQNDNEISFWL